MSVYRKSALFNALVREYQQRIIDRGMQEATSTLFADAKGNIDFLRKVRDGDWPDDDADRMRIRLQASGMLFDRQVPKRSDQPLGPSALPIDARVKAAAAIACEEVDEPLHPEPKLLDDAIAEAQAEESYP